MTLFGLWLVLAVAFVLLTGSRMPETVASHFAASGLADGFMPRRYYLALMAALIAGMPTAMVLLQQRSMRLRPDKLKLPHRDYWLAPERIDATRQAITARLMIFGSALVLLLFSSTGRP